MVKLHLKRGDETQFLYETTVEISIDDLVSDLSGIYNGRLKVDRICEDMKLLAKHGTTLPPNMQGLTDEQLVELKLHDEWAEKCIPSGGSVFCKDDIGRRNGNAPNAKMEEIILKTVKEAKDLISKKQVQANECMTQSKVKEAIDMLRGAIMIVYPMGLPPHETIKHEFENTEDLSGLQASKDIIEETNACIWWAGKEFIRGKKLKDFIGKNEKTKIIAKIQKRGGGAPSREAVVNEEEQKQMMAHYYKKNEEFKKLEAASEDDINGSAWGDNSSLKKQFQGLSNISWGPK